eukprot:scaffold85912_cov42-Attheya_sp.AAC.2
MGRQQCVVFSLYSRLEIVRPGLVVLRGIRYRCRRYVVRSYRVVFLCCFFAVSILGFYCTLQTLRQKAFGIGSLGPLRILPYNSRMYSASPVFSPIRAGDKLTDGRTYGSDVKQKLQAPNHPIPKAKSHSRLAGDMMVVVINK